MDQIIIVDDEEIIRNGLANSIDWQSMDFEVSGLFEDGRDAIEFLKTRHVDVVLTDVKMFDVSGIELARYVSEQAPQTAVIILSGYREFEYAQSAIKYGVVDYILKPADKSQIQEVVGRVRAQLDKQRQSAASTALPFDFCNQEEYEAIIACNAKLAAAAANGDSETVSLLHEEWYGRIDNTPSAYLLFIVTNLFESVYSRFDRLSITLDERFSKEVIFKQLGSVDGDNLFLETGKLLRAFCEQVSGKKDGKPEAIALRAQQYIANHLADNFTVDDVAQNVFLSVGHFSRCFKAVTGENVIDYIIRQRMEKAVGLIQENRLSTAEIGEKVGYPDVKYFQRTFKKHTGYTIKEYRRIMQ